MENYQRGALLTCSHDDCGCRIRVEVECNCPDAGDAYRCSCGAEMVPVKNAGGGGGKPLSH